MKTIIIILTFCLLPFTLLSQVDTANFEFKASGSDGKYTMLTNKVTFLGKAAGEIVTPIVVTPQAIDTSKWLFVPIGSDGTYRLIENKESFYGKDSGTVRAELVSELASINTVTTSSGICTLNTQKGIITTDVLAGTGGSNIFMYNSFIREGPQLILLTVEGGGNDMTQVILGFANRINGSCEIVIGRVAGTFDGEVKIHFSITN